MFRLKRNNYNFFDIFTAQKSAIKVKLLFDSFK